MLQFKSFTNSQDMNQFINNGSVIPCSLSCVGSAILIGFKSGQNTKQYKVETLNLGIVDSVEEIGTVVEVALDKFSNVVGQSVELEGANVSLTALIEQ
jgi:hypothetical protein